MQEKITTENLINDDLEKSESDSDLMKKQNLILMNKFSSSISSKNMHLF